MPQKKCGRPCNFSSTITKRDPTHVSNAVLSCVVARESGLWWGQTLAFLEASTDPSSFGRDYLRRMHPISIGVVVFPGSNCDHDAYHAVKHVLNQEARFIWHKDTSLGEVDAVILPGGFSYGDYLRSGAIARFSPVMEAVIDFANSGGLVLGVCNGFQVLCEAGLLPGALARNASLRFVCRPVLLRTENADTPFTGRLTDGQVLNIPVAHGDGNYLASEETLDELDREGRVVFPLLRPGGQSHGSVEPERVTSEHRRHHQPGGQRHGNDAASRTPRRGGIGLVRWAVCPGIDGFSSQRSAVGRQLVSNQATGVRSRGRDQLLLLAHRTHNPQLKTAD